MIVPEKTYTSNPFVDNVIYYAKYLAMNCTVKDEEEALNNETQESLRAGDVLIACVEGRATYYTFKTIPKEILEKYIPVESNLDVFVNNPKALKVHLDSYGTYEKARINYALSKIARETYIDHYVIMTQYLESLGEGWLENNRPLYNGCISKTISCLDAELFNALPEYTRGRIIKKYLNNYDNTNLDSLITSHSNFVSYYNNRSDVTQKNNELSNISQAMRDVFTSHYEMMIERGYVREARDTWFTYVDSQKVFDLCKKGEATYKDIYDLMPINALEDSLNTCIGATAVTQYHLLDGLSFLEDYFNNSPNAITEKQLLNRNMQDKYFANYQPYLDFSVLSACHAEVIGYFTLINYIPKETLKMILNTQIEEYTNLKVYSEDKKMLDSYLSTLSPTKRQEIMDNITKDMIEWYPLHHEETNNYYRSLIGLPPLGSDGKPYEDTLMHSWNEKTGSFIEFGKRFIEKLPTGIYPEIHWRKNICEFDAYDVGILDQYGVLDEYLTACGTTPSNPRYRYLRYLADNKLDIYRCRRAYKFDLIGIPTIDDTDARKRFVDCFAVNSDYVIRTVYSEAHKFQSDYYDKFMIIFTLINTIMDMLSDITAMIIDREVFDARCIKWLFESFGVPYYSEIPIKYLRAMLKNLNLLLKYKSSTKNMIDICRLFGFNDVRVFGYYLFKDRMVDPSTGEYVFDEDNSISYNDEDLWVRDPSGGTLTGTDGSRYSNLATYRNNNLIATKRILVENEDGEREFKVIIDDSQELFLKEDVIDGGEWKTVANNIKVYSSIYDDKKVVGTLQSNIAVTCSLIQENWYKIINIPSDSESNLIGCYVLAKYVEEDTTYTQLELRNVIIYDFIPLKDSSYFTKIKADTTPAELKFIKVPVDELLTKYKNDEEYIVPYDEIVYADEGDTWDGGLIHEYLEQQLLDHDFNAVKSKYISVETVTDLTEQAFQVTYFYNMLFDNLYSEEALTVKIPYIKINHTFRFMDVVCYLFALMYYYNGIKDKIMYSPTQILYIKGYNFDEALNELMNDPKCFAPQDEIMANREDIFDVNERIAEDNYNYREQFNGYDIKSFNLEADVDALDAWLWDFCQMRLDDFIVDDSLINFDQIITLRQFYSLNNSYYQTDIFKDAVAPIQYNQELKSAYGIELYEKTFCTDLDGVAHAIVVEGGYKIEVINDIDGNIFVLDYNTYITMADGTDHSLYYLYKLDSTGNFVRAIKQYYYFDTTENEYTRLFNKNYYILDANGRYIFTADNFYEKDDSGNYNIVTDEKYFINDKNEPDKKCLVFGRWWIQNENGEWILDPDQAYVYVIIDGVGRYIKYNEVLEHTDITVEIEGCYIKHDNDNGTGVGDGHFIKFSETDYYRIYMAENKIGENTDYFYDEVELYVEVPYETDETDVDLDGVRHYYKKVSTYLNENKWTYGDGFYIYDPNSDEYIGEKDLLSPNNCYFEVYPATDETKAVYDLVINNLASYYEYGNSYFFKDTSKILVLDNNNDYTKYSRTSTKYVVESDDERWYVYDSDEDYIIVLSKTDTYDSTKSLVVVFNKAISESNDNEYDPPIKYNPELTDEIWDASKQEYVENWDENDWFYNDSSVLDKYIGMNGENTWYYIKPGTDVRNLAIGYSTLPVGSGFYLKSEAYIGDIHLTEGDKYYISFDIETNFTGKIQIYNTADDSVNQDSVTDKVYDVAKREKQHIFQIFTANSVEQPSMVFVIYDFKNYPIHRGDYVILSNIRVIKANSSNFISQDIPSYDKLQEIYRTNEAIYKWLSKAMAEESDFHKYGILKKIYDSLMISKYNKEAFKIKENTYAKTYTEFLENRDAVLYARLMRFISLDPDAMHKEIADEIVEVTYAVDDCVDTYSYGFLNSYFPAVSASYIQQYITKLINWFKSWKEHLLGVNTIYKLADPNENLVKILEEKKYRNKYDYLKHNVYIHGTVKINPIDAVNISGLQYRNLYDFDTVFQMYASNDTKYTALNSSDKSELFTPANLYSDIYTQKYSDFYRVNDRVRLISRTGNRIEYKDPENNLRLIFNNDEIVASIENDNKLKITTSDSGISSNTSFNTIDQNKLNMITEETPDLDFISQYIDEINLYSGDHIDWRNLNNE